MDKEYLQNVYDYLREENREYYLATKESQKTMIEKRVRLYSHNIKADLYCILNENAGSGLFEHGFFQTDLSRSLKILKDLL